ncbi:MAG: hypothetical protein ACI936_001228 [Paraglaciecola sp.]|jgi:hypothetical protein
MKTLFLNIMFLGILAGCIQLPVSVKGNHFRFENFRTTDKNPAELVSLMCFRKKPSYRIEPKQFVSGENSLWLLATIEGNENMYLAKEAVANFNITLDAGKSYMANRIIQQGNISMWIQEVDTGLIVSDIVNKELSCPTFKGNLREKQCKSGTL